VKRTSVGLNKTPSNPEPQTLPVRVSFLRGGSPDILPKDRLFETLLNANAIVRNQNLKGLATVPSGFNADFQATRIAKRIFN
jgi:hypothetical protein